MLGTVRGRASAGQTLQAKTRGEPLLCFWLCLHSSRQSLHGNALIPIIIMMMRPGTYSYRKGAYRMVPCSSPNARVDFATVALI